MVRDKKKELRGLISDEGALFIIAKEHGVNISLKKSEKNIDGLDEKITSILNRLSEKGIN